MESSANATGDIQQVGGFVNLADGSFAVDPQSTMSQDSTTYLWRTSASPPLLGSGGQIYGRITYSKQLMRWLPVSWNQLSPDGLTYAYADGGVYAPTGGPPSMVRIHVVDPRAGSDRVVLTTSAIYDIVWYLGRVIYLSQPCPSGCGPDSLKLWRLDVDTGAVTKVSDRKGFFWAIDRGAAWVAEYDQSSLIRVDLATGQEAVWYSIPGVGVRLIGVDGRGAPLLNVGESALVRVTGPQQAEDVFSGVFYIAVPDGTRTWLGEGALNNQGIYVLSSTDRSSPTRDAGIRKVSDFKGLPLGPP